MEVAYIKSLVTKRCEFHEGCQQKSEGYTKNKTHYKTQKCVLPPLTKQRYSKRVKIYKNMNKSIFLKSFFYKISIFKSVVSKFSANAKARTNGLKGKERTINEGKNK